MNIASLISRIAILRPLAIRDFRLFWTGFAVSLIGDGIYIVTIAWQALEIDNSPYSVAIVSAAWMLPMVLVLLLGGVLADRFDRRKLLIISDVIRLAALVGFAVLSLTGVIQIWHMVILAALYGVGDALFGPAFGAFVPQLVPKKLLVNANALDQSVRPIAFYMVGPILGAELIGLGGTGLAFAMDALTFVISVVAIALIRTSGQPPRKAEITIKAGLRDLKEGFDFVRSQRWLWVALIAAAVVLFAYWGPLEVILPYWVKNDLGGGVTGYSRLLEAAGLGAVLSSIITAARGGLPQRFVLVLFVAWGVGCGALAFFALTEATWQAMVVMFLSEGAFAVGTIIWGTMIQMYVPPALRGRVSSFDWFVSVSLMPLSFILAAPVSKAIGAEATLVGGGILAGIVAGVALLVPGVRNIERQKPPPDDDFEEEIEESPVKVASLPVT
jgi:DHA3 family tetracycline resistance protein-like MFS transporter